MLLPQTETLSDHQPIDALPTGQAVALMLDSQAAAIEAVRCAGDDIAQAAQLMSDTVTAGGSLIYAAAGSSGLMALADASELPGTFGIPFEAIHVHVAGGVPVDGVMPGDTEDDVASAREISMSDIDTAILLSASGSTPYALAVAESARSAGAKIIAIANNPDAPLLADADIAICLQTPPEIIAGSTRLGAGTAQKAALNAMSSLMGVKLGHVYNAMMVNVTADNAKLRGRASRIVQAAAQVSAQDAQAALEATGGRVKLAILVADGADIDTAETLLSQHNGQLGPCLRR